MVVTTQCKETGHREMAIWNLLVRAIEAHCTPLQDRRRLRGKQHNFLR